MPYHKIKKKFKLKKFILCVLISFLFVYLICNMIDFHVSNIYIINNNFLTDQEIIEIAGLENYPTVFSVLKNTKKKLIQNDYIKSANVSIKKLKEVYITIDENYPLFYNSDNERIVLSDGTLSDRQFVVPILINYIPDSIYNTFINKMGNVDYSILNHISEIEYNPNQVDEERFLLTMTDGNLVYLTLDKFDKINDYLDIIKNFDNNKGILYLDSGEYFKKVN